MSMEGEQVMRSALAGIVPDVAPVDEAPPDPEPELIAAAVSAPDLEADIERRISSRLRASKYAQRRAQREGRYESLRSALLKSPNIAASSGELMQMIFSPLHASPQQPTMIEQQADPMPGPAQAPRSALADLVDPATGEVASPL